MRRRELILLLGGAMTTPGGLRAQQKAMPVVGVLNIFSRPPAPWEPGQGPVADGLREAGYIAGQNVTFEYRFAEGHYDLLPTFAADLVARKVDVIVAINGTPPALAAKSATSTIPIVFEAVGDPVGIGLVATLARPASNLTGFTNITTELMPKRVELLSQVAPQARAIVLLVNPSNANAEGVIRYTKEAASAKGMQFSVLNAATEGEIEAAFTSLDQLRAGGLVVDPDGFLSSRREQVVALASRHAVPAIYAYRDAVAAGGLISYGIDDTAARRQAGIYAGRILKGAKPADLPVQQPTTFELVVNLKTAKSLGLTVPQSIVARADEVIE
jgi:putative tryptophan/tyrosine transport system substrate-binding protein